VTLCSAHFRVLFPQNKGPPPIWPAMHLRGPPFFSHRCVVSKINSCSPPPAGFFFRQSGRVATTLFIFFSFVGSSPPPPLVARRSTEFNALDTTMCLGAFIFFGFPLTDLNISPLAHFYKKAFSTSKQLLFFALGLVAPFGSSRIIFPHLRSLNCCLRFPTIDFFYWVVRFGPASVEIPPPFTRGSAPPLPPSATFLWCCEGVVCPSPHAANWFNLARPYGTPFSFFSNPFNAFYLSLFFSFSVLGSPSRLISFVFRQRSSLIHEFLS